METKSTTIIAQKKIMPSQLMANRLLYTSNSKLGDLTILKRGIWVYFFLLLFEGALRKWVLPGLATPLLIVRDPVAIWLLITANKKRLLTFNSYIAGFTIISILAIITAVLMGHGNILVAIYGARIYLIHFPLIYVIGKTFDRADVLKMGRVLLWLSIPMTFLIAAQFYSPQSAWVNRGIGNGDEGGGFDGANGFFRPPATFSFITGTIGFYGIVAGFIVYFWLNAKLIKKPVLIASSICLLAAIPFTISRSVFFEVMLTLVFGLVFISRKPKFFGKLIPVAIFSVVAIIILGQTDFFQTSTGAFTARFENANETEGGFKGVLLDRFLGGLLESLSGSSSTPFFGYGIGMGTNVGAMLLSGKVTFLIAEVEWGRMIGEMGAILGLGAIFIRVALCFDILKRSFNKMLIGDTLPWMILSFALLLVAQGQWAQPTILGFSILSGGLVVAALKG